MRSVIADFLTEVLGDVESDVSGEPAGYIPELATADPDRLGAVFAILDGRIYGAGDMQISLERESGRRLDPTGRTERVVDGLSAFAGRRLSVDEAVCASQEPDSGSTSTRMERSA